MEWVIVFLLFFGCGLMFLAGLGILRMPDVFTRMHASTKAASLGIGLLLLAAALYFRELGITTKALTTIAFVFVTAPVGAHMLGRVAYLRGTKMWENSVIDEAKGRLGVLASSAKPSPPPEDQ
jgi:multicomponent Na+:H+ antiporter subunit G